MKWTFVGFLAPGTFHEDSQICFIVFKTILNHRILLDSSIKTKIDQFNLFKSIVRNLSTSLPSSILFYSNAWKNAKICSISNSSNSSAHWTNTTTNSQTDTTFYRDATMHQKTIHCLITLYHKTLISLFSQTLHSKLKIAYV